MRHTSLTLCFTAIALAAGHAAFAQTPPQPLKAIPAAATASTPASAFDGVVEAVRQTVIAAQVPGAVIQLDAKVGDRVKAGQVLLRIDARAAEQSATASDAQVQAARASLELATKDFERQQRLFQKNYISQAAMERAESAFKSAQAQANALLAQASASRTQSGYHVVRAPFAGVVSEVPVSLGDMAMPGRPLLTVYDPTTLRVTAAVPQSVAARMPADSKLRIELPGLPTAGASIVPARFQMLPTVDAATHTVQLRADLPAGLGAVAPGMFARVWLPLARGESAAGQNGAAPLSVPLEAVVRRAELTGLYVLDPQGKPVLRQVRLGRAADGRVEVLSGLMPGEQVVTEPQSATRVR
ncbi:MAG TPA: efflux RND transporter periplasmic adaptor subunit [Rhodocyclaceae bacterium]|nr:efflux RND transporter periplasmic adaptor subunit [Rhodocyclaceae bacterium]